MNENVKSGNAEITKQESADCEPFVIDPEKPTEYLFYTVSRRMDTAENMAIGIYNEVVKDAPAILEAGKTFQKGFRLVVSMSDEEMKAIGSGAIKLVHENGKMYAQVRNKRGYGTKLPIRREDFNSFDLGSFVQALQMQAIQNEIETVHNQVLVISDLAKGIAQGQIDDRIGLYLSGVSLFIEARSVSNTDLAAQLRAQALRSISDAAFQLSTSLTSDIRYIVNKEYIAVAKKEREAQVAERMNSIEQKYAYVHKAMMMKAAIYYDMGETKTMAVALQQYAKYIENVIVPNAMILSQVTTGDDGSINGRWQKRAVLRLDVSSLAKKLGESPKEIYLGVRMEEPELNESRHLEIE